jgi:hypothetical protein
MSNRMTLLESDLMMHGQQQPMQYSQRPDSGNNVMDKRKSLNQTGVYNEI